MPLYSPPEYGTPTVLVYKTADEVKTTDTVLAPDTELFVPLKANTKYFFRCVIINNTGAAPDMKLEMNGPSASVGRVGPNSSFQMMDFGVSTVLGGGGVDTLNFFFGYCEVAATPGNLTFDWAQNSSSATPVTVQKGSSLTMWEKV